MNYLTEYATEQSNEQQLEPQFGQELGHEFEQAFEHLPFFGEAELESERGGRSYRPPVMRARPMPRSPKPRSPMPLPVARGRRPRWPLPYYGGGWPYGAVLAFPEPFPEPYPQQEPNPQPFQDGVDVGDGPPSEGEAPPTLNATLARLPTAQRPAYQALGTIAAAIADQRSTGPGLYLIEFTSDGRRRAYSGQSGNVRKRLLQHQLCARMLGLSLAGHQVYVAALPALSQAQRRALEQRIHGDMLTRQQGVLTNQRRELEVGLLGAEWE
jgi:hypothetical protein